MHTSIISRHFLASIFFLQAAWLSAQAASPFRTDTLPTGAWARREVANGDTVFEMSLRPVRIVNPRKFKDLEEQAMYNRYKYAAKKVYPYALQAISLYEDIQEETQDMSKRKRKRFIRQEHKELKEDLNDQMKNLSKTQGKVLIKMIEKELGKPFYDIIRETRGSVTAVYWHNLSKIWGYDLKQGYQLNADPMLDEIFLDYDFGDPYRWYQ